MPQGAAAVAPHPMALGEGSCEFFLRGLDLAHFIFILHAIQMLSIFASGPRKGHFFRTTNVVHDNCHVWLCGSQA